MIEAILDVMGSETEPLVNKRNDNISEWIFHRDTQIPVMCCVCHFT
jgi:hypothetical protein